MKRFTPMPLVISSRAIAIVLFLLTAATLPAQGAGAAKKYALLIGVTKYRHAGLNDPQLHFPEADARALRDLFKESGYDEIDLLLGSDATQKAIRAKLDALNNKAESDGVIVVGFFGHGVEIEMRDAQGKLITDDNGNSVTEGCFCPYDTRIRIVMDSQGKPVPGKNGPLTEPDPETLVKLSYLMRALSVAQAKNRVVFADCCRTIPNVARGRSFGASFNTKDLPPGTAILFGCSPNEKAFDDEQWGHGAFTKCLLQELPQLAQGGTVRTGTLIDRMIETVPRLVRTIHERAEQTPIPFFTASVDLQLAMTYEGTKAGQTRSDNSLNTTLVWIEPGKFTMGSPKDENGRDEDEDEVQVKLTKGFWLGQHEVRQAEWQRIMQTAPWTGKDHVEVGNDYPATYLSWKDATEFCEKLTEQERSVGRLPPDWQYALPTEAQWEYACRAGIRSRYSFGDGNDDPELNGYAWWGWWWGWFDRSDEAKAKSERHAHPVGQKKANPWGMFDMHGNVWEWCRDRYAKQLPGGTDPEGPSKGVARVFRGGGWDSLPFFCRSAKRRSALTGYADEELGFRVAVVPTGK